MNEITLHGYTRFSKSRDNTQGGVGITCLSEMMSRKIIENSNLQLDISVKNRFVYSPIRLETNLVTTCVFFDEFSHLVERIYIISNDILILGDYNIHIQ